MAEEHVYIVTYDIADARRWRAVFRLMNGFGEWMQLSVFQCRLTRSRLIDLQAKLTAAIHPGEDHVMLVDIGPADSVKPKVQSLGLRRYQQIEREAIVV
ncbi:MAG: hypothetical protein RL223_3770 [Pseudomonadota bacterium]|jgi:CRISPR-associated protein Cas2